MIRVNKNTRHTRSITIVSYALLLMALGGRADESSYTKITNTDLIKEADDSLLLLSTLDGSFIGISQRTGIVKWQIKDEPAVKVPIDTSKAINPMYLPDPKDGSLYVLSESDQDALKKLPFTIPQLVASSPCRSSDGILYTGKKVDTWFSVDPITGEKQEVLSYDKVDKTCPISNAESVLIGRTEYNIMMLDSKNKGRSWNVTFFDYSANLMEAETRNDYPYVHFVASSSGRALSIDRHLGSPLWQHDYGSPVIAMYILEDSGLVAVPFTSIAEETLDHLVLQFETDPTSISSLKLYPTLYVGEHLHGMYALPSLVDQSTATIAHLGLPLLEGPSSNPEEASSDANIPEAKAPNADVTFQSLPRVTIGHHKVPEYSETVMRITGRTDISAIDTYHIVGHNKSNVTVAFEGSDPSTETSKRQNNSHLPFISIGIQTTKLNEFKEKLEELYDKLSTGRTSFILSQEFPLLSYTIAKSWLRQQENLGLKLTVILLVASVIVLIYLRVQDREYLRSSQGSNISNVSSSDGYSHIVTAEAEDVGAGNIRVGKIIFNREEILGKGCEGTFVYKGEFDRRAVAVKRILPECFTVADREVALLRESDAHPNVVRYFCTEQDRLFRYIALELCAATLQDYVEGRFHIGRISARDILHQAVAGLQHLHSLNIVHRDIKPHNVLLSMPDGKGEVRAMISDFGLCKKLKIGRTSFSRQSGVTGTEGWIAPEMMNGCVRATCAVDIFSLGCVFYYVLTDGKHPFGDELRRQSNIVTGDYRLADLEGESNALQHNLISAMITADPGSRPSAVAVRNHPVFWNGARILAFFQDVSDHVEKDDYSSPVLRALEHCSLNVVRRDWRAHISEDVAQDLRKFRSYTGSSVRDLLRALRNKEILPQWKTFVLDLEESVGDMPEIRSLNFLVEAKSSYEFRQWLAQFEEKNKTTYSVRHTEPASGKKVIFKQRLTCQHNTRLGRTHDAVAHKMTKNTNCPSKMTVTIHAVQNKYRGKYVEKSKFFEQMPCEINLMLNHNHITCSAASLKFRRPSDEVKEKLIALFEMGHSPATALEYIKTDIQLNFVDSPLVLADRSKCPDYDFCYHLYTKICNKNFDKEGKKLLQQSSSNTGQNAAHTLDIVEATHETEEVSETMHVEDLARKKNNDLIHGIQALLTEFSDRSPDEMTKGLEVLYEKLKKIKTPSACASHLVNFGSGKPRRNHGNYIPVKATAICRRKINLSGCRSHPGEKPRNSVSNNEDVTPSENSDTVSKMFLN